MIRRLGLAVALFVLASGCTSTAEEGEADEEAGTQAGASSVQFGVTDFCGDLFLVGSLAPKAIGDKAITYGWTGRVSRIGDDDVSYTALGMVSSIGREAVGYGAFRVSTVGDRNVTRGITGRVTRFGDATVAWDSLRNRPSKVGDGDLRYGMTGVLDKAGDAELRYGFAPFVSDENRFALCLAVYMTAATAN